MEHTFDPHITQNLFRSVKPYFRDKLGKYTHQRVSGDWHFHGLAFVKEEMTYVFGFNVGFFRKNLPNGYDTVGMNVLVRTNGISSKLRTQYEQFFDENLKGWYFTKDQYTSFRGEVGSEFGRYQNISDFRKLDDMVNFVLVAIDGLNSIYPKIFENTNGIFDDVMRASYPWHDTIADVCASVLNYKPVT